MSLNIEFRYFPGWVWSGEIKTKALLIPAEIELQLAGDELGKNAEEEMEISENGPLLAHADNTLKTAVFVQSKVLDRLKGEKSRLGFMDV